MPNMERVSGFLLAKLSFRQQLICTFTLGIVLLALITSFVTARTSLQTIETQMILQGQKITLNLARQSTLALLYHSVEAAEDAANITLGFPDVVGVALYTKTHSQLLQTGSAPITKGGTLSYGDDTVSMGETELLWDFSAPVYSADETGSGAGSPFGDEEISRELIGYVHVINSKASLQAMSRDILRTNLATAGLLALVLLSLLLLLTNRVTRPIKALANRMQQAQEGDYGVRAQLEGPSDIMHMEQAFNTMMDELQVRQQELALARDSALASALLKGQFVASVSHELRTPMNSILGMIEMIAAQGVQAKAQHYLKIARNSGEQLLRLINDILDFSKLESAKMQINVEMFDLNELIQEVVDLLYVQAKGKHLLLGAYVDPYLPKMLNADRGRIRQILINMLGNAIKFTQFGCVSVTVSLLERVNHDVRLKFEVKDTGIGIAEAAQRAIFQAFTQADNSTTRLYGGTGLGLAISHQLVELMGGELGVDSSVGNGSNFWFTLVLGSEPLPQAMQTTKPQLLAPATGSMLVLLTSPTRVSLFEQLAAMDYVVDTCHNMTQVLQRLRQAEANFQPYSVLIIDASTEVDKDADIYQRLEQESEIGLPLTLVLCNLWQRRQALASQCYYLPSQLSDGQLHAVINSALNQDFTVRVSDIPDYLLHEASMNACSIVEQSKGDILVVEDNRANQYVVIAMLEKLGYQVIIAANGQEALQLLPDDAILMIFMDCHMPIMDGYECTKKIRSSESNGQHIPIIAMTADVSESDRQRCFAVGMDDYLPKPINLPALQQKLDLWLGAEQPVDGQHGQHGQHKEHGKHDEYAVIEVAGSETTELIDRQVLAKLREQTGNKFSLLVKAYLEDTPDTLSQLHLAIDVQEPQKIRHLSHLLKGSSVTLGATSLTKLAKQLESASDAQTQVQRLDLINRLKRDFGQVALLLSAEISEARHSSSVIASSTGQDLPPYVLVVDDDRSTRLSLRGCLEQDGYYIEEAHNGAVALASCERQMPDLILMDAMMKEMNGFEAMRRILLLADEFKPPILMLTASDDEAVIGQAFEYGAMDFIPKPVNLHVLRKRVAHLIRTSQTERHIHQLAYHDPLTSLPNRTQFMEKFAHGLQQTKSVDGMLALMFIDLDKFKFVNDTQGHDVGDMLLKAVAKRITHCVRTDDLVVRLGGDEFTILLENIQSSAIAARIAQKICKLLAEPFTFMDQAIRAPVSIGIAVFPTDGQDINTLMRHADTAMYRAKAKGGNHFQFYEYGMEAELIRRIELERELRHALDNDELVLHYQPQIELETGRVMGAEALVRWNHPDRGFMAPDEFIPLAEESGLILPLGEWVLNESCRQIKQWRTEGLDLQFIAVNLSGHQMKQAYLLQQIKTCLSTHKLAAEHLQLEMTESVMAVESEACLILLNGLKQLGVSLAIDDFGTGYSSLSYLTKFPVDTLKIDRSFITNLTQNEDSAAVVSGIIALAHKLRLQVIAEGVETAEQRDFLLQDECDWIQGYLISRPLGREDFEVWLKAYDPLSLTKPL